jgi:hypothetical protein
MIVLISYGGIIMGNSESKKDKNTIIRHSLVGTSNGQNDIRKIIKKKKKNKN